MATARLSKPKPDQPKKPGRALFDKYLALREERLAHNRQADALDKQEKEIAKEISAYVGFAGGAQRTVECCGHRASITSERSHPYWLGAFTKLAGQAEVDRLRSEAPLRDKLKVEKL